MRTMHGTRRTSQTLRTTPRHARLHVCCAAPSTTQVYVHKTAEGVAAKLCADFADSAKKAIAEKGSFSVAVPGGSVLKMLSGLKAVQGVDWSKVHLFYVNHKLVPDTDASSTHFKARGLFLDAVGIPSTQVASVNESTSPEQYQARLAAMASAGGVPVFDYMLLGMGKDGHVGSLYPGRQEVLDTAAWVMKVDKKSPASLTLSLAIMNAAKQVRVALVGEDKAEAALTAITKAKSAADFPVCGVQGAYWMVDDGCARLLGSAAVASAQHADHTLLSVKAQ